MSYTKFLLNLNNINYDLELKNNLNKVIAFRLTNISNGKQYYQYLNNTCINQLLGCNVETLMKKLCISMASDTNRNHVDFDFDDGSRVRMSTFFVLNVDNVDIDRSMILTLNKVKTENVDFVNKLFDNTLTLL